MTTRAGAKKPGDWYLVQLIAISRKVTALINAIVATNNCIENILVGKFPSTPSEITRHNAIPLEMSISFGHIEDEQPPTKAILTNVPDKCACKHCGIHIKGFGCSLKVGCVVCINGSDICYQTGAGGAYHAGSNKKIWCKVGYVHVAYNKLLNVVSGESHCICG